MTAASSIAIKRFIFSVSFECILVIGRSRNNQLFEKRKSILISDKFHVICGTWNKLREADSNNLNLCVS